MLEKLIKFIFRKHVKSHINPADCERKFVNYTNAKTILLLYESDLNEENIEIRNIIKTMKADGKKVVAWGFLDKKYVKTPILFDFRILNKQNLDFFHKPKLEFLQELTDQKFDLLIDLSVNEIIPLQYLNLYSNATLKSGLKKNNASIYDFMIEIDKNQPENPKIETEINASYIYNQIIFYLKSIQTKD
jgi:hypothetical protein